MGEIADAMINGEFDYTTGEYLGKGVGYPRTKRYFKNRSKVRFGNNYQSNKSKVWRLMFCSGNPANISTIMLLQIVKEYAISELKLQTNIKEATIYKHILKNEEKFNSWYEKNYPHFYKYLNKK